MLTHLKRLSVRLNRQGNKPFDKEASVVLDYMINQQGYCPSDAVKIALVNYGVQLELLPENIIPCQPMVADEDRIAWRIVEILEESGVLLQQQVAPQPKQDKLKPKTFSAFD